VIKFLFSNSKPKRKAFFYWNFNNKISNFKINRPWLSSHCIPAQKLASVSTQLYHKCS